MINKMKLFLILGLCISTFLFIGCSNSNKNIKNNKNLYKPEINANDNSIKNITNNKQNEDNKKENNKINNEVKKLNKTIVIDPGHSSSANLDMEPISPSSDVLKIKDGGGAIGVYTNIPEYSTCMSISLLLKDALVKSGFDVVMTKENNDISLGNVERAEIGNNANANLVVRIHADSVESPDAEGASILVPSPLNENTAAIADVSTSYANIIINNYCSKLNLYNRGVIIRDDMTGFNWSKVPVVILEMGFISNPNEDAFLSNTGNHSTIANIIAESITLCFNT